MWAVSVATTWTSGHSEPISRTKALKELAKKDAAIVKVGNPGLKAKEEKAKGKLAQEKVNAKTKFRKAAAAAVKVRGAKAVKGLPAMPAC